MRTVNHPRPLQCGECVLSYEHLTSLLRHIKDVHTVPPPNVAERIGDGAIAAVPVDRHEDEGMAVGELREAGADDAGNSSEDEDLPINLQEAAGKMVLNLRQTGGVTGSTIERCQNECYRMMQSVASSMRAKVREFLDNANIDTPASRNLLEQLQIEDPFSHLRTMKQQLSYFASQFGMVKPETKFIGYRVDYRLNPVTAQYEPTQVPMSFEYISVIQTLKLFRKNPKNRELVAAERASEDGILRTYLDGRRSRTHPLVTRHPRIYRLSLYWDDIEVVNPLGSKTTIHKIAAFYFSIQNIPLVESGQLSSIYLLALAYSEDLKGKDRFQKVLPPFLYELRKLESAAGVTVDMEDEPEPEPLRATLCVLCADTLAAHEILGYLSPSARHFCRKCMVSRGEFRENMNAVAEKRTKAMYEEHVRRVSQNYNFSTECGVKGTDCALHASSGFDATQDAVFDIFHDFLEGLCHWVTSLTLRSFILVSKYFDLEDFNGRVAAFNYGVPDIRNKPSANFSEDSLKGSKLKQKGSQMWCLIRVFGFLVSDVPADNVNLKLVNLLQSIMLIVFAEAVRPEDIDRLERLRNTTGCFRSFMSLLKTMP